MSRISIPKPRLASEGAQAILNAINTKLDPFLTFSAPSPTISRFSISTLR